MSEFLLLCVLSRLGYAFNDVLTGRQARLHGPLETAAWRGVALAVLMAPLLLLVQDGAWAALAGRWVEVVVLALLTSVVNLLAFDAARYLPFGLRAGFLVSSTALASLVVGAVFLGERPGTWELVFGLVLVGAAVAAAPGPQATHEIRPRVVRGALVAGLAGVLMAFVALLGARLARGTDPWLTAWVWEASSGLVLFLVLAARVGRRGFAPGVVRRAAVIGLAASPTVVGSGLTMLALERGALGLWAAVGGMHILFAVALGWLWHAEPLGARRVVCFAIAALAVAGLAVAGG